MSHFNFIFKLLSKNQLYLRLKLWNVKLIICIIFILRSNVEIFESYFTQVDLIASKTSILNSKFNFQNPNFNLSIMLYMTLSINMIWNNVYLWLKLDFGREFSKIYNMHTCIFNMHIVLEGWYKSKMHTLYQRSMTEIRRCVLIYGSVTLYMHASK